MAHCWMGEGCASCFLGAGSGRKIGTLRTDVVQPIASLPEADAADAREGSIVAFLGRDYDVVGRAPDGLHWFCDCADVLPG